MCIFVPDTDCLQLLIKLFSLFFLKHILCSYVGLYGCIARLVMVAK